MKKQLLTLILLAQAFLMSAQVKIDRIDPTDWYAGMKDPSLQLMVYGQNIGAADVSTDYPDVRID